MNIEKNYIYWCIISNVLFGAVYIPHVNSIYANDDLFEVLRDNMNSISSHYSIDNVCILGDFNARTGIAEDFTILNEFIVENVAQDAVNADLFNPC